MTDEQDVRAAFTRMVDAGPPPTSGLAAAAVGRRARHRRALGTAAGAAAALLALLAAVTLTPGWRPVPGPPASTPGVSVRMAPLSPLTAEQVRLVLPDCADEAGVDPADYLLVNAGGAVEGYLDGRADLQGTVLLASSDAYVLCDFRVANGRFRTRAGPLLGEPDPVTVDLTAGAVEESGTPLQDGYYAAAGRVAPSVRRVRVRFDGVRGWFESDYLFNSTFLVQVSLGRAGRERLPVPSRPRVTVEAYDAADRRIATIRWP